MQANNIIAQIDKFSRKRINSVGFLICVNSDVVYRDELKKEFTDSLKEIDLFSTDYNQFFNTATGTTETSSTTTSDTEINTNAPNTNETPLEVDTRSIPNFEIGFGSASYSDPKHGLISTKVLDIQCCQGETLLLKELFSSIDFTDLYKTMVFIPRGLAYLHNDTLAYKSYIDKHLDYMSHTTQFAIAGLTSAAMNHPIEGTDGASYTTYYCHHHISKLL
jgi:hypothetical protein